jgi:hypothetical protein
MFMEASKNGMDQWLLTNQNVFLLWELRQIRLFFFSHLLWLSARAVAPWAFIRPALLMGCDPLVISRCFFRFLFSLFKSVHSKNLLLQILQVTGLENAAPVGFPFRMHRFLQKYYSIPL